MSKGYLLAMPEIIKVNRTKSIGPIVVNVDIGHAFNGTGDAILLSYIASGCPDELHIKVQDGKRDCLKYFDINLSKKRSGVSASAIFDQEVKDKGSIPRLRRACEFFKINGQPKRPSVLLPDFAKEAARNFWAYLTPRILFCPEVNDASREWPHWKSLSARIGRSVSRELTRGIASGYVQEESDTWAVAMAIIASCDIFVGLDSAYAHLAGVFDRHSIVILGPTKPSVFAHCPKTLCLTPPEGGPLGCGGCSYGHPFDKTCKQRCLEIERISEDAVANAIGLKLRQR